MRSKIAAVVDDLEKLEERIGNIHSAGIVDGFSSEPFGCNYRFP